MKAANKFRTKRAKLPAWSASLKKPLYACADRIAECRVGPTDATVTAASEDVRQAIMRYAVACDRVERPHFYR